jgi:hypothetical protein
MIIFHLMFKILKYLILKVKLSRIFKNIHTCTKYLVLQNGLHVGEILILKKFNLVEPYKNMYVLSNYECYNHNISKFYYEVGLNTILTQLVSNILSTYFYDIEVVQTLYLTSHKLNVELHGFIFFTSKYFESTFLCPYQKLFHFLIELWARYLFFSILPCQHP